MSGVFFGPPLSAAVGILAAAVSLSHGIAPALVPAITGVAITLGLRPMHSSLAVFTDHYVRATLLSGELQEQRGKLNRTIKDLDASYQLVEESNRELILARQEADSLRQLRHSFATNLSHELRTPLNIILGFINMICLKPRLYGYPSWTEPLLRDLTEVRRSADYLSDLVDDVVDLARADAMALPIRREVANLRHLIEQTEGMIRSLAATKGLALVADCDSSVEVLVDPVRIEQVFV